MRIDEKLCCDTKLNEGLGPFKKVQFVLIRVLFAHWKQPIYYDFDKLISLNFLFEIIKTVETKELYVKAVVSDLEGN